MHVYGWTISAKVASFGWKERRQQRSNQHQQGGFQNDQVPKARRVDDTEVQGFRRRSFVEVLNGECGRKSEKVENHQEEVLTMSWNIKSGDTEWLRRCAVGILKSFSRVTTVNSRLSSRGFSFSANYLGDKSVLWLFETELDNEGFIKNRFFWDDCFESMTNWSDAFSSCYKTTWINCMGTPSRLWNDAFFLKLGWMIGEPLMVHEETK